MPRRHAPPLVVLFLAAAASAKPPTTNPSFDVTTDDARSQFAALAEAGPVRLERPLVILGGFLDLGFGTWFYADRLQRAVSGKVIRVTFADCRDFEECRRRVVARVDAELGAANARETVAVDVIGHSMGGLVGLYAAVDDPALEKRLNVRRLFTIASPLTGARRAERMPRFMDAFALIRDMRPRSAFYERLARRPIDAEVVSYTLLDDTTVGEPFAALPGRGVWWLDGSFVGNSHPRATFEPRIMLDIARRLRGEPPLTRGEPSPLPSTRPAGG